MNVNTGKPVNSLTFKNAGFPSLGECSNTCFFVREFEIKVNEKYPLYLKVVDYNGEPRVPFNKG